MSSIENMSRAAHSSEKEEIPPQGKVVYEAPHIREAREIARHGGFEEALKTLKEKGILNREIMRVKALYLEKLSNSEPFMTEKTWEALTIMELYHPETADHCVETYRIARDKIEQPLLGSGVTLSDIFFAEEEDRRIFYRACLLHDIGKVDIPYDIISNTVDDNECVRLLYNHRDDVQVRATLKRNGIEALPSNPKTLIHELAFSGHRPMDIAPAELLLSPEIAEYLTKRGFDVNNKTLAELIRPHEGYSGSTLEKLGLPEESTIAARHHNYQNIPSDTKEVTANENLFMNMDVAEILHLADVEQAMKAHRGYKPAASNVAAMAALVHEAELGHIKNTGLVAVWVLDEMEQLAKDHDELKEDLNNSTDHAYLEAIVAFLSKHTLARIGVDTRPAATSPRALQ